MCKYRHIKALGLDLSDVAAITAIIVIAVSASMRTLYSASAVFLGLLTLTIYSASALLSTRDILKTPTYKDYRGVIYVGALFLTCTTIGYAGACILVGKYIFVHF